MINDKTWKYTLVAIFCGVLLYALLNWMEAARSQEVGSKLYRCVLTLDIKPKPEADIRVYDNGRIVHNGREVLKAKVTDAQISYGFTSSGFLFITIIDLTTMKMTLGKFKPQPLEEVHRVPGTCMFLPKV